MGSDEKGAQFPVRPNRLSRHPSGAFRFSKPNDYVRDLEVLTGVLTGFFTGFLPLVDGGVTAAVVDCAGLPQAPCKHDRFDPAAHLQAHGTPYEQGAPWAQPHVHAALTTSEPPPPVLHLPEGEAHLAEATPAIATMATATRLA